MRFFSHACAHKALLVSSPAQESKVKHKHKNKNTINSPNPSRNSSVCNAFQIHYYNVRALSNINKGCEQQATMQIVPAASASASTQRILNRRNGLYIGTRKVAYSRRHAVAAASGAAGGPEAPPPQHDDAARAALLHVLDQHGIPLLLDDSFDTRVWPAAERPWRAAIAAATSTSAAAATLSDGITALLAPNGPAAMSAPELARALLAAPALVAAPLASWAEFLAAVGFAPAEVRGIILSSPELLVKGDLVTAGAALQRLEALGCDDNARRRIVIWAPQMLAAPPHEVEALVRGLLCVFGGGEVLTGAAHARSLLPPLTLNPYFTSIQTKTTLGTHAGAAVVQVSCRRRRARGHVVRWVGGCIKEARICSWGVVVVLRSWPPPPVASRRPSLTCAVT
jgi:hypothetical protein